MRGTRSDRSNRYTPVPQAVSDEDEGVYEESPESSQQAELISAESIPANANSVAFTDDFRQQDPQTVDFCGRSPRQGSHTPILLPLAFIEADPPYKSSKMSVSRRICFLLSISVCMAYMVALLWLIPCHMAPCFVKSSHPILPLHLKEWSDTFPSIRFVSRPQVVKLWEGQTMILLAFQLMDHSASTLEKNTKEIVGGVIALRGEDGQEAWRCPFYTDVMDVMCHTDVNKDGIVDCAVLGSTGLLATVNASNGYTFWYLHDHDDQSAHISAVSSPCPLTNMDFDRDGVDDFVIIAVVTYVGLRNVAESTLIPSRQISDDQFAHVGLLLVSGSNGQIIGQPLPLSNMLAPDASISFRKIPNLVVYSSGNNTKSLLLLLGSGDRTRINHQSNPETVLMVSLEDLFTGVTKDSKGADTYVAGFRNVYSAKGKIQSITIMGNEKSVASDVVLLTGNNEELICLGGANELRVKWKYSKEKYKISQPVLGNFNNDGFMDIFLILMPVNCSSCNWKSMIMVLDGQNGWEIMHKSTESMAFNPTVLHSARRGVADRFLFKTMILESSEVHEKKATEGKTTLEDYGSDKSIMNRSAVLLTDSTNASERETWDGIQNYGINKGLNSLAIYPNRISDNDYYLKKVEKIFGQELRTDESIHPGANSFTYSGTEHDKPPLLISVALTELKKDGGIYTWEIDLPPITTWHGPSADEGNDIVIEDLKFSMAYLVTIGENTGTSTLATINLSTRMSQNSCNRTATAGLHPTAE